MRRWHGCIRMVDEVIPVATRRWRGGLFSAATWGEIAAFRRRLRNGAFDVVVDTQGLIRSALIACMAPGVKHGYDADSIREPFASRFYDIRHTVSRDQHAVARNRALVAQALGFTRTGVLDYGSAARVTAASRALRCAAARDLRAPTRNGRKRTGSRSGVRCVSVASASCCPGAVRRSVYAASGCRRRSKKRRTAAHAAGSKLRG